jgi:hypothetical protein
LCAQDPALRPSAQDLLQDAFVRDAELTEHLEQRIALFLQDRRPVSACPVQGFVAIMHSS